MIRDRLSSIDLLQVKKLKEHVYQKILKLDEQNTTSNDTNISVSNASSEAATNQQQKNSINGICRLKDAELAKLIEKSHRNTALLLAKLKKAKKVKTKRFGSTEREIRIIDDSVIW